MSFTLFEIIPPKKWQAGSYGSEHTPLYFDCADCGAKAPPIAGIIADTDRPNLAGIAVFKHPDGFYKTAMFCETCYAKRLAAATLEVPA